MIYFVQTESSSYIKIGYTISDIGVRLSALQTGNFEKLNLIGTIPGTMKEEKKLHEKFNKYLIRGEWYEPAPEILEYIKKNNVEFQKKIIVIKERFITDENFLNEIREMLDRHIIYSDSDKKKRELGRKKND